MQCLGLPSANPDEAMWCTFALPRLSLWDIEPLLESGNSLKFPFCERVELKLTLGLSFRSERLDLRRQGQPASLAACTRHTKRSAAAGRFGLVGAHADDLRRGG
jgi:hypothetical protein